MAYVVAVPLWFWKNLKGELMAQIREFNGFVFCVFYEQKTLNFFDFFGILLCINFPVGIEICWNPW